MKVTVRVAVLAGLQCRYFVYDENGTELRQVDRRVEREVQRARKSKTSLREILEGIEDKLGAELPRGFSY